eukprot:11767523-Alexandrium_andersonii.AAC.1
MGWLHEASLSMLVFMLSVVKGQPDIVITECTQFFDVDMVGELLAGAYTVEALKSDPADLGLPVHRRRLYTRLTNVNTVVPRLPWNKHTFDTHLAARPVCNASIFFRAPKSYVCLLYTSDAADDM